MSESSADLDFWSFVDLAHERLAEEFGDDLDEPDTRATALLLSLNRASGIVTYDLEASAHRPRGRSWTVFRLMFVLWLAGPQESHKVAELTGMSRAAVSSLVKPLVGEGVVARTAHERDGRSVMLSLTDAGTDEIRGAFAAHHAREREWAAGLTPTEQRTLTQLLTKLIGHRPDLEVRGRS